MNDGAAGPALLDRLRGLADTFPDSATALAALLAAVAAALLLHWLAMAAARRFLPREEHSMGRLVLRRVSPLVRLALILGALAIAAPALADDSWLAAAIGKALRLGAIGLAGWTVASVVKGVADITIRRHRIDVEDNLLARKHRTQVRVLARTAIVVVVILTVAVMLLTFPAVRELGLSLFASAGVAGLVIGLAARPVLSNLLAGIQIALTQPIRIEDAVVVEGEWGWIEEIATTYVVIRIWDWRRLVVPLSYFIEQPFQNWTRHTASIIGNVTWHVDYSVPIEKMRAKVHELLHEHPLWDRNVAVLQVIEAHERTVEVRALMSAKNSPSAWDLRCAIREKVIDWLQGEYPGALPRLRTELNRGASWDAPGNAAGGAPGSEREAQDSLFPPEALPERPPEPPGPLGPRPGGRPAAAGEAQA